MKHISFHQFVLSLLLVYIASFALMRLLIAEIYVYALIMLVLLTIIHVSRNNVVFFTYLVSVTYFLVISSWSLASGFLILPRNDIYHYYPFMRYIYEIGCFTTHVSLKELEDLFLGIITPWPIWHILIVMFSRITLIELFYTVQVSQLLMTAPLIVLASKAMASRLYNKSENKDSISSYLLMAMIPFSSFYVYTNTNPVSRSYAEALYVLLVLILLKMHSHFRSCDYITLMLITCATIFAHPLWSMSIPTFLLSYIMILFIFMLVASNVKFLYPLRLFMIGFIGIGVSIIWILYCTHTAKMTMIELLKHLSTFEPYRDLLGQKIMEPWLKTALVQGEFFKVHPLEYIIRVFVWITDLLPLTIILFIILPSIIRNPRCIIKESTTIVLLSLCITSIMVALLVGAGSNGFLTRYVKVLVYVPLCLYAVYGIRYLSKFNRNVRLQQILVITLVALYVLTSSLSLGTRTYQASFIWSSNISFQDKGMHSPYYMGVVRFFSKFCNYESYRDIIADDTIIRIFFNSTTFIKLSKLYGLMPPHTLASLLELYGGSRQYNVLILSIRNFKPTYWALRGWVCNRTDLPTLVEKVKQLAIGRAFRVYDDGRGRIYLL